VSQILKLTIDNNVVNKYHDYYFKKFPKRNKKPIESPTHPSINKWMVLPRIQMNDLKQKWKDFIIWFIKDQGYQNKKIDKCTMTFVSYFKTKIRKDCDNTVPKFILDGMADEQVQLIVDDDSLHVEKLILECGYDKENPRTDIFIEY
jgi:hypothetical protein